MLNFESPPSAHLGFQGSHRNWIKFRGAGQHDLTLAFPSGAFELVSAQYLHSPIEFPRVQVLQEAASAVTPGGLLLIVDHASTSPGSWTVPEETLALLDLSPHEWHTERLEAREREATRPNGQKATVTDNVIALRRLAR